MSVFEWWWWSRPVDATLCLEGEMECGLTAHKFHRGLTASEKTELWDRWKRGESLKAIGRAFGKQSSSIYFFGGTAGGIRPAERRRSRLVLTLAEREVISRGVTAYQSVRSIAKLLGRSPSTVSREMSRNGGCDRYRAACGRECRGIQSQRALAPAAITTLRGLLRRAVCDSDASILAPGPRRHQSIGRFCMTIRIGRSSVQSTAAYSFKLSNHRPNWNASR
jgi:DNA-binding CsgD family transcriptional regulator